jgi:hypothetical protein
MAKTFVLVKRFSGGSIDVSHVEPENRKSAYLAACAKSDAICIELAELNVIKRKRRSDNEIAKIVDRAEKRKARDAAREAEKVEESASDVVAEQTLAPTEEKPKKAQKTSVNKK